MKKVYQIVLLGLFLSNISLAQQWNFIGSNAYYNNGNVGIGTNNPVDKLDVLGISNTTFGGRTIISDNGNYDPTVTFYRWVGSGTNYNSSHIRTDVNGSMYFGSSSGISSAIGGGTISEALMVQYNGNIGVGTNNPFAKLNILKTNSWSDASITSSTVDDLLVLQTTYSGSPATYNSTGYKWGIQFWGRNDEGSLDQTKTGAIYAVSEDGGLGYNRAVGLAFHTTSFDATSTERLRISSVGNVGIGTSNPQNKLDVNGTVHSKQVNVDLNGWSDYVLNDGYVLTPLNEVKAYIEKNHHLPEIPSADELSKTGLDLGEMSNLQMKKIEELTLYLIEKDREIAIENQKINKQAHALKDLSDSNIQQRQHMRALNKKVEALIKVSKNKIQKNEK